jgi:transposase
MIVPHLRPYPEDNSVLVIDNCTVHKNDLAALVAMVEAVGAKVRFLAPYCPIDNPIECAFSSFKACWRRHGNWLGLFPLHLKIKFCFDHCGANGQAAVATYRKSGYV